MAWIINLTETAKKQLSKLPRDVQIGIRDYLRNKLQVSENPKQFGKPLRYDKVGLWRYRVDKYRIICKINDDELKILIIKIMKRDKVYD